MVDLDGIVAILPGKILVWRIQLTVERKCPTERFCNVRTGRSMVIFPLTFVLVTAVKRYHMMASLITQSERF